MFTIEEKFKLYKLLKGYEKIKNISWLGERFIVEKVKEFYIDFQSFGDFIYKNKYISKKTLEEAKIKSLKIKSGESELDYFCDIIMKKYPQAINIWYIEYLSNKEILFEEIYNSLEKKLIDDCYDELKRYSFCCYKSIEDYCDCEEIEFTMNDYLKDSENLSDISIIFNKKDTDMFCEYIECLEELSEDNQTIELLKNLKKLFFDEERQFN